MTPRHYQSVVSIGSQCLTGVMLQNAGLKRFSGPFDWIFSNMRMVCDCIEDDFAAFLDRDQLVPIPLARRHDPAAQFADHALYQRRYKLNAIFNHSDPMVPEVHAYLQRCVARFREVLRSDRPQLLLAFSRRDQGGLMAFNRLCDLLEDAPTVEVCAFILREPGEERSVRLWEERGRHRLFDLHLMSAMSGIHFEDAADNAFVAETLRNMVAIGA